MHVDHVEITCSVSRLRHAVADDVYVRSVRLGSRTIRALCGHRVRPTALVTPPADDLCPACAGSLAVRVAAS